LVRVLSFGLFIQTTSETYRTSENQIRFGMMILPPASSDRGTVRLVLISCVVGTGAFRVTSTLQVLNGARFRFVRSVILFDDTANGTHLTVASTVVSRRRYFTFLERRLPNRRLALSPLRRVVSPLRGVDLAPRRLLADAIATDLPPSFRSVVSRRIRW
jgi:hypothetical protein